MNDLAEYKYLILLIFVLMSCKTKEIAFSPDSSDIEYIHFGAGGGFTGKVTKYYLTMDGNLYLSQDGMIVKIGKASEEVTKQIFKNYNTLGFSKMTLNQPGNYYQFIESHRASDSNKIIWSKEPIENKNLDTYFANLMAVVKKLSVVK